MRTEFGLSRIIVIMCFCLVSGHIKQHRTIVKTEADEATNCSAKSELGDEASDFPEDLFTLEQRRDGAVVLHLIGSLYCFILIAIVCNDYFLPSVDCICQDLKLTKDVAGATFMALATSAPELFVNIIGTFLTHSDLGVGTVVGSDVFNTLGVAACGGLAARAAIKLEIWPLARDCSIFMAVVALLGLILWDEKVEWYEALTLVFLYILYCAFLFCQRKLHRAAKSLLKTTKSFSSQLSTDGILSSSSTTSLSMNGGGHNSTGTHVAGIKTDLVGTGTYTPYHHHGEYMGYTERRPSFSPSERRMSRSSRPPSYRKQNSKELLTISSAVVNGRLAPPHNPSFDSGVLPIDTKLPDTDGYPMDVTGDVPDDENVEYEGCLLFTPPDKWSSRIWWLLCWPLSLFLFISIPDCRRYRRLYPLTFIMCTVWIGLSSYFVSWMMTMIGQTFGISDSVMGLTLVAIGGSMPEASTSIINARKGIGSMSISNALGGNTLDILLSLGLPWFIKTQLPLDMHGGPVIIQSHGLIYNNAAQLACTVVLFLAASFTRFKMNRVLGIICLIMYLAFIAFIVMVEVDVFHLKPPSEC